jgi:ribosome-interacting GTPase 1
VPANLSPEYKAAEAAFRKTRDPRERLDWLREMLRAIPKHKGTEHLQADIKARIKDLAEELERARKGGGHGGPALVIHPEGAAQIALIGPPNAGKSSLHARLTGSGAHVAPYPFTTQYPQAGMMPHEDVHFQLIDIDAELQAVRELTGLRYPVFAVSATTGRGLGEIGPWLFRNLGIVRVYTKAPGRSVDKHRPFTLRRGQTVGDVARLVHQDLGRSLRYARIWGQSGFEGQQVGHEHRVADGDIVELHA